MKVGKVLLNILVLSFIVFAGYRFLIYKPIEDITVDCNNQYNGVNNEMTYVCTVTDTSNIADQEHPVSIQLSTGDTILETVELEAGENTITFDTLSFNSAYDVLVEGYLYDGDTYTETIFYEDEFNTIDEAFTVPSLVYNEIEVTDTSIDFSLDLTDPDALTTMIEYTIYDESNTVIDTDILPVQALISASIDQLSELSSYTIIITVTYEIDTAHNTATFTHTESFTTLRTPLIPSASITDFTNDNVSLGFTLNTNDNDGSNVVYSIELRGELDQVLASESSITPTMTFDVSSITEDFTINVVASYDFGGTTYTDVTIYSYMVYDNEYSTFFTIPTLTKVDTSQPLTDYSQYKDYLYTWIDQGISEFSITCDASLDCTTLVEQEPYNRMPFDVAGFVHPYYSINQISFSYTSAKIDFTTTLAYTEQERVLIDTEVNTILNTIITAGMTKEDKILAVHDYIVNNAYYDEACYEDSLTCDNDHSAYGILFDGNAVCEGYAHLADIMLRALGIESFRVSSLTHQWNAVYVNDMWLHMDTTWDDPVVTHGPDILRYDYYLITTATLYSLDTESHTFDTSILNFMS